MVEGRKKFDNKSTEDKSRINFLKQRGAIQAKERNNILLGKPPITFKKEDSIPSRGKTLGRKIETASVGRDESEKKGRNKEMGD